MRLNERNWSTDESAAPAPRARTARVCPRCGSRDVVRIVYGLPTYETFQRAERGEFELGGCVVGREGGDPNRFCRSCGLEWIYDRRASRRVAVTP